MYVCTYVRACMYVYMCVHVCVCMRAVCVHVCVQACVYFGNYSSSTPYIAPEEMCFTSSLSTSKSPILSVFVSAIIIRLTLLCA